MATDVEHWSAVDSECIMYTGIWLWALPRRMTMSSGSDAVGPERRGPCWPGRDGMTLLLGGTSSR